MLREELGHSDAKVLPAIVKLGDPEDIRREAEHLAILGDKVAPRVYATWQGGMAIQHLPHAPMLKSPLLVKTRNMLEKLVWVRPCPDEWVDHGWTLKFRNRFGHMPPAFIQSEQLRLIHGDPTLANIVEMAGHIRLIDPKPPGRGIPSMVSVDRGKMLQSIIGWELALGATDLRSLVEMQLWPFVDLDDQDLLRAIWWCMMHYRRIAQREKETDLGRWAAWVADTILERFLDDFAPDCA